MAGQPSKHTNASLCTNVHLESILADLSPKQRAFLAAKSYQKTDIDACAEIGISVSTMRHWPKQIRELIRQGEAIIAQDAVNTAIQLRRQAVVKAMSVKVAGLDSEDEAIRQRCATEIIEHELGKAGVRVQVETENKCAELMERIARACEEGL